MGPAHIFRHAQAGAATGGGGGLLARVQEVSWGRLRSGQAGAGFSLGVGDADPPPGPSSTSWLLNHDQHTSGQEQPLSQGRGVSGTQRESDHEGSHRDFSSRVSAHGLDRGLPDPDSSPALHLRSLPHPLLPKPHPPPWPPAPASSSQAASHTEGPC